VAPPSKTKLQLLDAQLILIFSMFVRFIFCLLGKRNLKRRVNQLEFARNTGRLQKLNQKEVLWPL
jgi:hypothetical protein